MNNKDHIKKMEISSLRAQVSGLKRENSSLKNENEKLKERIQELEEFKVLDEISLKEIVDKYHQTVVVEAKRNKTLENFSALSDLAGGIYTGGY